MTDWNDLRYFLAVARTGSTLGAARALNVNQTTAARRVAALEAATGLHLFERRQAGYALTLVGEALIAEAEAVERAAAGFEAAAAAAARDVSGAVRLSTVEVYAAGLLAPMLKDLRAAHPGIRLELDTTEKIRDLGAGEADIALRGGAGIDAPGLYGRRIGPDPWTLYCSRAYAEANGVPPTIEALRGHPIIGGGGDKVWPMYRRWLEHHGLQDAVVLEHGSTSGLLSAIRAGLGLAVLPSFMADREPDLVQVVPPVAGDPMELWLVTHDRVRHVPRVRAVMDFLGERLQRLARTSADGSADLVHPTGSKNS